MRRAWKEFFLFPDILILSLAFPVLVVSGFLVSGTGRAWLGIPVGALLFSAMEYATHRFVFHMSPPKHPVLFKLLRRLHYDHHERPDDLKLLFLPIWYSGPQLILVGAVTLWLTDSWGWALLLTAGSVLGLLHYEWTHYVAHRPVRPITKWGRRLKRQHLLHHFKNERYWFGVTHSVCDRLFGTFPDEKEVQTSATARKLTGEKSG
nr:sterol desaturase family protein [Staphylospora marina]